MKKKVIFIILFILTICFNNFVVLAAEPFKYESFNYELDSPFTDAVKNGPYTPKDTAWQYQLFDVEASKYFDADYYRKDWDKFLYDTKSFAGYYFGSKSMRCTAISNNATQVNIGTSIKLVPKIAGKAIIMPSTVIITDATLKGANAYLRITLNGNRIWPFEKNWYKIVKGQFDDDGTEFFKIPELNLDLKATDTIRFEFYGENAKANSVVIEWGGLKAGVFTYIDETITKFNSSTDFVDAPDISPFWSYEYSLNGGKSFSALTVYNDWGYNMAKNIYYLGASKRGDMWVSNGVGDLVKPENKYGIVAYTYTAHKSGYIQLKNATVLAQANNEIKLMKIRITRNCKQIWPVDNTWKPVTIEKPALLDRYIIEVKKGDKIRFEATAEETRNNKGAQLTWNPFFVFSSTKPTTTIGNMEEQEVDNTQTKDEEIFYNDVFKDDSKVVNSVVKVDEIYKGLSGKEQFDQNINSYFSQVQKGNSNAILVLVLIAAGVIVLNVGVLFLIKFIKLKRKARME